MTTALIIILALLIGLFAYALTRPNEFRVERDIVIDASPETIFAYLNDLKRWDAWSPWAEKDTAMEKTSSGSDTGVGAIYEWNGNKEVGQGRMEIVESKPASDLRIKLDFLKPFEAHNMVDFSVRPEGNGSRVTWGLSGPNPLMMKIMTIFKSMDKMIGADYEKGLSKLKRLVEGEN